MLERNAINKHKRQSVVIGATVLGPVDLTDIPEIVDIPDLVDLSDRADLVDIPNIPDRPDLVDIPYIRDKLGRSNRYNR